jgi:hypothetical protein
MAKREEMVRSNENLREENYLSYLYLKFYVVAVALVSVVRIGDEE